MQTSVVWYRLLYCTRGRTNSNPTGISAPHCSSKTSKTTKTVCGSDLGERREGETPPNGTTLEWGISYKRRHPLDTARDGETAARCALPLFQDVGHDGFHRHADAVLCKLATVFGIRTRGGRRMPAVQQGPTAHNGKTEDSDAVLRFARLARSTRFTQAAQRGSAPAGRIFARRMSGCSAREEPPGPRAGPAPGWRHGRRSRRRRPRTERVHGALPSLRRPA